MYVCQKEIFFQYSLFCLKFENICLFFMFYDYVSKLLMNALLCCKVYNFMTTYLTVKLVNNIKSVCINKMICRIEPTLYRFKIPIVLLHSCPFSLWDLCPPLASTHHCYTHSQSCIL